ncbi:phosphoribosylformylglycinamidine cyclo-ligase [Alkalibacter saccharofermentans]|uniref:Phosphoribosylformylglycinamidine cyclo-ligase n=1 Tax=Alkalibacter saccharofermentans DSM 14828 TaxID=1120975 RepID=A0A1M4YDX9_9FIRM|nr:phosphoribosylformylglycinamidine cyclo-ligase [Alkalibacter saccharofermentans]SHF03848.1 phosphoribosylformylglycinamidine cyclo-ligase [Alkalibacter saccharofermentans DSM 14828]
MKEFTYKDSGVDIEAGYESVDRIKKHVARTKTQGVISGLGGFGGMFELPKGYKNPVLISGTDGVGTKLLIAQKMKKHDTIGIDCVAMCVNDIACQGAMPLYFLDYIACGKNNPEVIEEIVKGVCDGCVEGEMALIGGETAEMPDMYHEDEYDLAGFAVGVAEKSKIIDGSTIEEEDVIIGVPSSGVHSNGFSLVRKLLLDHKKYNLQDEIKELEDKLGNVLLTPTKIYVKSIKAALEAGEIKGIAHITGGGFYENVPRALPEGLKAVINKDSISKLPIFEFIQREGNISDKEMYSTFNMGIGLMLVVSEREKDNVLGALAEIGEKAVVIGRVEKGEGVELCR